MLGVDPGFLHTNDGRMPPVIHVDTDAPLHSDRTGKLITDQLWGLYYKPDFHFNGVQGGAMPYKVETPVDQVRDRSLRPGKPGIRRLAGVRRHVDLGARVLPQALRGPAREYQTRTRAASAASLRIRFPVFDRFRETATSSPI